MTTTAQALSAISSWIDQGTQEMSPEAVLLHRVDKVIEEVGEVYEALSGWQGTNPRKGITGGPEAVIAELLDVAATALVAVESLPGNQGISLTLLMGNFGGLAEQIRMTPRPATPEEFLAELSRQYDRQFSDLDAKTATPCRVLEIVRFASQAHDDVIACIRAGNDRTVADAILVNSLLMLATVALAAVEHLTGDEGRSLRLLDSKVLTIWSRTMPLPPPRSPILTENTF